MWLLARKMAVSVWHHTCSFCAGVPGYFFNWPDADTVIIQPNTEEAIYSHFICLHAFLVHYTCLQYKYTIQYKILNDHMVVIFLHSIPEVHRPFLYQQCCINYCTWDRHSYNEALLLEEARCRQFRQFPVMGLTLGQMLCDVFAAVKGCFMLFLCQSSCPQKDRLSKRSKRAKINPSYSISDLLPLV